LAAVEDALGQHQRLPVPHEHARTLLAYGATLRRAGRRRNARAALDQALATFEALGQPLWAERARDETSRLAGRKPAGQDLTSTELQVARLVAEGRSNREVADALFITIRTVEANLTRIYRKLGVRSRAELAAHWKERIAA
jgi:DNA-binding CsgD family transcriptional regulator